MFALLIILFKFDWDRLVCETFWPLNTIFCELPWKWALEKLVCGLLLTKLLLTPKEYDLLVYFINNKGIALSREQLLNNIWNYDYLGNDRTIDTHIKMLRNNLGEYRDLITTVRGMGYKFDDKE